MASSTVWKRLGFRLGLRLGLPLGLMRGLGFKKKQEWATTLSPFAQA